MKVGTYYYPEQWPREQWERDFDRMAAMGLKIVHMAEFAWGTIEPSEGSYQLDWLSDCVELAAKRKMDVILCTPTAVLPVWMVQKHSDILLTGHRFGGRRHGNHLHPALRDYSRKVVQGMVDRFGDHPSVIGWQIDNELASGGQFDQSEVTHQQFRQWLQHRYGTIERLNDAWGTAFWNTFYTDWAQILLPASLTIPYSNPHQYLDAARFWSWSLADYIKLQADVLKPRIGQRWITTNFMPMHPDIDPIDAADSLSLYSWDAYPASGLSPNPKDETFRMATHGSMGFTHDVMASYTGRWALMELQPGTINWSGVPLLVYPGAVRLWIWTAYAHGAEFVTTYRFRQPRFGIEQYHDGLIEHDGVSLSPGGREFAQTAAEMARLDAKVETPNAGTVEPDRTVGLMLDFNSYWAILSQKQAKRWDVSQFLQLWYSAIARLGLSVRIVHPDRPIPSDLKMLIVPGVQLMSTELAKRLEDYATAGGHLLLTCRTGLMNPDGHFWEGPPAQPILPMIGAHIEAYDSLPEGATGHIEIMDGGKHGWNVWGDLLYAEEGTKVLAKYTDQFYAGAVAATQRKSGSGTVTYSGVYADQSYHDALVEKLAKQFKLEVATLPSRVFVYKRDGYTICLNYNDKPVTAPARRGAKFVVGGSKIEPAGVAVWE